MRSFIFKLFLFLIFFLTTISALFGSQISGVILNQETGLPVPDANIFIQGTSYGTSSTSEGTFRFEVPGQSSRTLIISVIGFTPFQKNLNLDKGEVLNISLKPEPVQMDRLCITATKSNHLQSKIPVSSKILESDDFTTTSVAEQIEISGGIHVKNYGGLAGTSAPTLRGAANEQILYMIDGVRLNTAQGSPINLNNFSTQSLERIEIIKSGHSSVLGTNAIGGAINLITKENFNTPLSYGFNTTYGSFNTMMNNTYGAMQLGHFSIYGCFDHTNSDGDFSYTLSDHSAKSDRKNNDYSSNNSTVKFCFSSNADHQLQATWHLLQSEAGSPGPIHWNQSNARLKNNRNILTLKSEDSFSDQFQTTTQLFYHRLQRDYDDPDWNSYYVHKNQMTGASFRANWNFNASMIFASATEYEHHHINTTQYDDQNRDIISQSLFTEFSHRIVTGQGILLAKLFPSIRWDHYSDIDMQTNPNIGFLLSYDESSSIALRGNYGHSFRAPTFDDLYFTDAYTLSNPDLLPEESVNYDIGLLIQEQSMSSVRYELSYFHSSISNLINWVDVGNWTYQAKNVDKAEIQGVENSLSLSLINHHVLFDATHIWMRALNQKTGKKLPYRPDSQFDFSLGFKASNVIARFNANITGERASNEDNSNIMPSYIFLGGSLKYTFSFYKTKMFVNLQSLNLGNDPISIIEGYPLPGREYRVTVGFDY